VRAHRRHRHIHHKHTHHAQLALQASGVRTSIVGGVESGRDGRRDEGGGRGGAAAAAAAAEAAAGGGDDGKEASAAWWRLWAREAGRVGYLALPMLVVSMSQNVVQVSSNMMVGHLPGVLPLSSAAIATSLANVTGFSLLVRPRLSSPTPPPPPFPLDHFRVPSRPFFPLSTVIFA